MISGGPLALTWPDWKHSRQWRMVPSLSSSLNSVRGIERRTFASEAMSRVIFGPGTSTRNSWMSPRPRSSSSKTSFSRSSAGTSRWKFLIAISIWALVSAVDMAPDLSLEKGSVGGALDLGGVLAGGGRDRRVVDLGQAADQLDPLVRLQDRVDLLRGLFVVAVERAPADVDVVGVVGHRERVVGALEGHQRDDLVRLHRALEGQEALDRDVGDRARALVAVDVDAVDRREVDRGAGGVLGHVARRGQVAVTALHRGDGRLQAGGGEELERRKHAAVDRAGADVLAAAVVDRDALVGEHAAGERLLAHEHDLADARLVGSGAQQRVLAPGAVDLGRLEQLPAVEDRLRIDARGALAGRPDLEQQVRGLRGDLAEAAEGRSAEHAGALDEPLGREVLRVQAERGARGGGDGLAGLRGDLGAAARGERVLAPRVGEQADLGGH